MLVERAVTCSLAASLAYLSPGQLAATRRQWRHTGPALTAPPGQRYAARLAKDYTFAEQVLDPTLQASCTIFDSEDELCVAFRGATSARNPRSTLSERLVPLDAAEPDGARTHEGYCEASLRLYERLQPALERRGASARRVVFTGHAYGGGTAALCAHLHGAVDELLTFAAPLVGDDAFARAFDASPLGAQHTTRLQHAADPVLALSRRRSVGLGYVHTGRLVRCSPDSELLLDTGLNELTNGRAGGAGASGGEGGPGPSGRSEVLPRSEVRSGLKGPAEDAAKSSVAWNAFEHCRHLGTYMGPRPSAPGKIRWGKLLRPSFTPPR